MKQLKKALSFTLALALAISSVAPLSTSANTSLASWTPVGSSNAAIDVTDATQGITIPDIVLGTASLSFEKEYPKVGEAFPVMVGDGTLTDDVTYDWTIDGKTVSTTDSYTPIAQDLEKMLTVTVSMNGLELGSKSVLISNVMVVYIDTENNASITSKETYINGSFQLQGNSFYNTTNTTLYNGAMEIRGRGNSTWGLNKNPYKIKLEKSTDLLGFGKSKHWVLIANYMDESHMRNKLAYDLSQDMGMPSMQSAYVELVLNGEYVGLYQLCEQVRISDTRVNTFDWSKVSESVAKKIVAANPAALTTNDQTAIEDQMNTEMSWMTSKTLEYKGVSYNVADYYKDLPDADGGFLIELDEYWDEVSKFKTSSGQPIQISEPEYLATDSEAFTNLSDYIQDFEDGVRAYDFYSPSVNKSYTELADMDSVIKTWLVNEIFFNTETCKKSFYMYKDINRPLSFGPVWDMDWSANSDISSSETNFPTKWMTIERSSSAQAESWYKYMIKDPYFALKAREAYQEFSTQIQDLTAPGKDMDQLYAYIQTAANANYALGTDGVRSTKKDFAGQVSTLRTFLTKRLAWLDAQFSSVDTLYTSLQGSDENTLASQISLSADSTASGTTATVTVDSMKDAAKAAFYVNGKKVSTEALAADTATASIPSEMLINDTTKDNIVTVYILDSSDQPVKAIVPVIRTVTLPYGGSYQISEDVNVYATEYEIFKNAAAPIPLTGSLTLNGTAKAGNTLTAVLSASNITGIPAYQWFADRQEISGANGSTYQVRAEDLGKTLYVSVSSTIESGSVNSVSTNPVTAADVQYADLIIHQIYGGGNAGSNPVSHDFIEIYNPSLSPVDLKGYKISYLSNRAGKAGSTGGLPVMLELTGTIPSHTSFLIRCKEETTTTSFRYMVSAFDQEWNQTIDNKQYSISLLKGTQFIDGVSVNEAPVEGPALADGFISKQFTARRNAFSDKDNNVTDFVAISYLDISDENLAASRPRSLSDGIWGLSDSSPDPGNDDSELTDIEKFIQRLYNKVLSRTAEPEGMTYYNDLLVGN
ncbi:CotH kinase family protein [Anaerobium acetethylicum]|uniref:Lamin Tail Domain n=1 Tax=Anaerobium acetethylicum TaxID=1619234 RepID=A0A1D3TYN9_9FIRM|nr:CotH kinase family protein [Anaerobium acetethylicum]SCP99604.1 Lamin Tail Domain [Anaerobium acetethylicum]